jgi:signal transduction histidine kinase/CheY-like chemotaxis protein
MTPQSGPRKEANNAIEGLRAQIFARWRDEVRHDPEQAALIHEVGDQELEDHLPGLTDKVIKLLRGEPTENLEEDAAQHGRQRRTIGFSVVPLLRELQILRRVLTDMVQEIIGANASVEEIERGRNIIIDSVDSSMNASVLQFILAAEEERNSAQGEARELHEQRDRFLATLSHELRNQVSPILLGTQLLKDLKPSDRRMEKAIERIERQARHQAILIDDLLEISRFRYGKLQLKREDLDLRMAVQQALETFESDFQAKQLKIKVELPDRPLLVYADETRIAQVLMNFLSNAIKFTPPGGTITLGLAAQGDSAVLTVRDTGVGFNPEMLPELFAMFFQTNEPAKTVKTGLGVGLALVKVLVELHGGTVNAHSEGEGKGAEFTVRLPMAATMPERSRPQTRRVLVVDDSPDQLELLADLLRSRGYEVVEARDAHEALLRISGQRAQACVIDIGLPDMDGYELARKLREIPETRDSRLIAVTGYGTKADTHLFKEAGFDHYFPKPTNIEELNRVLSKS